MPDANTISLYFMRELRVELRPRGAISSISTTPRRSFVRQLHLKAYLGFRHNKRHHPRPRGRMEDHVNKIRKLLGDRVQLNSVSRAIKWDKSSYWGRNK